MASVARLGDWAAVIVWAVVVSAATAGAVAGYHLSAPADAIYPGVYVAGVHLGGLSPEEAEAVLTRHLDELLEKPILFYLGAQRWNEIPKALGIGPVDTASEIARAWAVGRTGWWGERIWNRLVAARRGLWLDPQLRVADDAFNVWVEALKAEVERPPQDAGFTVNRDGEVEVVPAQPGIVLDTTGLATRAARAALEPHARAVGLTAVRVPPALDTAGAEQLGIRRRLASYTTRFDPSQVDRTVNIRIAAEALDGLILAPGERFSFNERVGPRVEEAGYKEAPVIIDGELVPDIGGGVCQVSTTLHAAALLAGLKIVTRVPHSIPAAYVPLGLDATVAYDYIDFRFENDTGRHILVKAWVEGDRLTVDIYGHEPRFESARLETEVVEVVPRKVVRERRSDLAAGQERVIRQGRDGYRVHVWRVARYADGTEERELVSRSVYPARDALIWTGS